MLQLFYIKKRPNMQADGYGRRAIGSTLPGRVLQVTDARGKWHQMLSCNVRFDWCVTRLHWL